MGNQTTFCLGTSLCYPASNSLRMEGLFVWGSKELFFFSLLTDGFDAVTWPIEEEDAHIGHISDHSSGYDLFFYRFTSLRLVFHRQQESLAPFIERKESHEQLCDHGSLQNVIYSL